MMHKRVHELMERFSDIKEDPSDLNLTLLSSRK